MKLLSELKWQVFLHIRTFSFPFLFRSRRLKEVHFKAPLCDAKRDEILFLDGDFSSPAQFFLIVGVFAFLYSLLATIVYVFYQNKYLKHNRGPLVVSQQKLFQCPSMKYISMTQHSFYLCYSRLWLPSFMFVLFCPEQDFLVTLTFSFMWLVSSCCWAKALSDIKTATNPTQVLLLFSACRAQENKCTVTQEPRWSRLNTSVVGTQSTNKVPQITTG